MAQISRKYNFQPGQKIRSAQVDEELDQLVTAHNEQDTILTQNVELTNLLETQVQQLQDGVVPDGTISNAMLQAGAVSYSKLTPDLQEQMDIADVASKLYLYQNAGGW
ncbi:hypothetical protein [Paenibacillus spongiae]|uniref:Uncharacterized protein n=1 Tax=Paenibacillus spongiae TaxID=2909671 RepID=A0ABY5SB87_9BACL|nr:hypothetical protein [Paenibacillus spongiae]UVI31216.1 hypothetical protein L1F29_05060 [Paenibacillus spongiae]